MQLVQHLLGAIPKTFGLSKVSLRQKLDSQFVGNIRGNQFSGQFWNTKSMDNEFGRNFLWKMRLLSQWNKQLQKLGRQNLANILADKLAYQLFIVYCLLFIVYCLLFIVLLFIVYFLLFIVYCSFIVYCLLFIV